MRTPIALLVAVCCLAPLARNADGGPLPPANRTPETIDYAKPERYAKIPAKDGDSAAITKLAAPLRDTDVMKLFRNVHAFIAGVPHVPEPWEDAHRDFASLLQGFDHDGCASHALLFANLLRACGLPVVYVKSARHEWIRGYVATGERGSFDGHVFLEVFVASKCLLLDAQGMTVWSDYDPNDPELPGGLLAYEKGSDHFAMVHSTRRDAFIEEALARWKGFDVSTLRANSTRGLPLMAPVYAFTISKEWEALTQRMGAVASFNHPFWDQQKPKLKGQLLFVTSVAGRLGIPDAEVDAWSPIPLADLRKDPHLRKPGVATRRLDDGTFVVLLHAPGWTELMALIWTTNLEQIRVDFENSSSK